MENSLNFGKMDIEKIKSKKTTEELLNFGILNIDKPSGPTSFSVSDYIRKLLKEKGIKKTSHFGTLDPKVTGVLPIALGRGCKLTGFFIGHDKEYVGIMRFHDNIEQKKIEEEIKKKFIGKITQTPPVKSSVARNPRERYIKKFEILENSEKNDGKDFLFHVVCQGGTYIRKLVTDLGDSLKIKAHMLELRRTRAGIFSEEGIVKSPDKEEENKEISENFRNNYPSIKIYDFEKAISEWEENNNDEELRKLIIPGEVVSKIYPVIKVRENDEEIVKHLFTGKAVLKEYLEKESLNKIKQLKEGERICLFSGLRLIEIAKVVGKIPEENKKDKKGKEIIAKPEFVLQPVKN